MENTLLEAVYRECGGKPVTSRQGTAVGGNRGCEVLLCLQDGLWVGLAHLHAGLSVRSTQRSGTVPVELCGVRRALQTSTMEGEAFSLRGPSALSRLAGSGSGTI